MKGRDALEEPVKMEGHKEDVFSFHNALTVTGLCDCSFVRRVLQAVKIRSKCNLNKLNTRQIRGSTYYLGL